MPAVCDTCKGTGRIYTRKGPRTCPRQCENGTRNARAGNSSYMLLECALNYRMGAVDIGGLSIAVRRASVDHSFAEMAAMTRIDENIIRSAYER